MCGKRVRLGLLGVIVAGWLPAVAAGFPWETVLTLRRVEANPDKSYRLSKDNGPWMIMACSFSGEGAEDQARELALELRKRYKLEAYTYRKTFELGDDFYGRGVNRFGEPPKMQYRLGPEMEEVAVLVGNYPSVDDPEAQATLQKIKYFRPQCLEIDGSRPTTRTLAGWRVVQQYVLAPDNPKRKKGPMGHALITTNPMLPQDYFVPKGLDPLVVEANEGVTHCLLDCPGKYTVQVATFRGRLVTDQREIEAIEDGRKTMKSELVEATEKAHNLTEALRLKGYDAYEFHDRYASIVTVGSFDWVARQLPNGQTEFNPAIQAVIDRFGPVKTQLGGATGGWAQQTLMDIPFDLKPMVVEVPRRSISAEIGRGVTRRF
jgi:hypothetical protein